MIDESLFPNLEKSLQNVSFLSVDWGTYRYLVWNDEFHAWNDVWLHPYDLPDNVRVFHDLDNTRGQYCFARNAQGTWDRWRGP